MSEINIFKNFILRKMSWQMMWTSCMCIEFILVGTPYILIRDNSNKERKAADRGKQWQHAP
jgi:hypothetical protein